MPSPSSARVAMILTSKKLLYGWPLIAACLISTSLAGEPAKRPNILWLSCEDISPHLGCYGDPHAMTPHLDQLAEQGTRFTHAFTAAGVCAPCRSTVISGMYQNSIGTHHMRCNARLPQWMRPFPMLLRDAGYYCTNNSKTDYQFRKPSTKAIWDDNGSKAHWKNRPDDQPFFAVFNFTGCHESGIADADKYQKVTSVLDPDMRQDPSLLSLPPYYPDTPRVREDWKRNYELITAMDIWAGEHLKALSDAGLAENTIVVFWSDHGVGLPRAKRWLYDSGTRVPFIVRAPKVMQEALELPNSAVSKRLVSSVDFGPTVLSLAGIRPPEYMQGKAFLGEHASAPREFVYGARDRMDERYDIIRTVRNHRYRYIRNYEPLKPYYQYMNTPEKGATMQEIRRSEATGGLPELAQQFSAGRKPVEELYDLQSDPHEVHNLAQAPEHSALLMKLRTECLRWQSEIRDLGLVPEAEIEARVAEVGSEFSILRSANRSADAVTELVDLAAAASDGPHRLQLLLDSMDSQDAVARYWGATGIGNNAVDLKGKQRQTAAAAVGRAFADESACVRIAAARAACRLGRAEGLGVLQTELKGDLQWARLAAAIALDELDEFARPALRDLQSALEDQPNKYIVRVANKAVNDLLGTTNAVP